MAETKNVRCKQRGKKGKIVRGNKVNLELQAKSLICESQLSVLFIYLSGLQFINKNTNLLTSTEFFAENMGDFFIFLRRFADEVLESSAESLEHVLTFITVFMGNIDRCEPE